MESLWREQTGGAYAFLEKKAEEYFPGCKVEAKWSAQDCMPHDGIPFIGKYSKSMIIKTTP